MYFSKFVLPEDITIKITKETTQNLIKTKISDFFVFGQEKILDLDNSMNSFVGCCSLGTGHLDSFMQKSVMEIQDYLHYSRMIQGHKTSLYLVEKYLQSNRHNLVKPILPR